MGFDYERIVQDGLRRVVRSVLQEVSQRGLEDPHHFYISFRTDYPGVELPAFVKRANPEEITVVLQHQFWDLSVSDDSFSVVLSFQDTPHKIRVPFYAVLSFMDPGVRFGLHFTPPPPDEAAGLATDLDVHAAPATEPASETPPHVPVTDGSNVISLLDRFRKK